MRERGVTVASVDAMWEEWALQTAEVLVDMGWLVRERIERESVLLWREGEREGLEKLPVE